MSKKQNIARLLIETSDLLDNDYQTLNESTITLNDIPALNYLLLVGGFLMIGGLIDKVKKIKGDIESANKSTQIDLEDLSQIIKFINNNSSKIEGIIKKYNIKNYDILKNNKYEPYFKRDKIQKNKAFFVHHIIAEIKLDKHIDDIQMTADNLNSIIREIKSLLNHKLLRKYRLQICGAIMYDDKQKYKIALFKPSSVVNKESIYFKGLYKKYWDAHIKRLNKRKSNIDKLEKNLD